MTPVIVAYFDGEEEFKVLSNFAFSPFELDGISYSSVEAFWQSLKTEIPELREQIYSLYGLPAKKAGRIVAVESKGLFTYNRNIYKVGSRDHHILLERALRAKFEQHDNSQKALLATEHRPLKHMLKNKFGQWRPGDSPALPSIVFENMLHRIRTELQNKNSIEQLEIPKGLNETE